MPYRDPPSDEEELERLSKRGTGCAECESRSTHGGRDVCRRQVAGKYNRQIFYNRGDSSSRPPWCPRGLKKARKGYASTEPLPEAVGKKKPEPKMPPPGPTSPMPLNPRTHIERKYPRGQGQGGTYKGQARGGQVPLKQWDDPLGDDEQVIEPAPDPPKEPKLKRKAKDAPWGVTEE